MPFLTDFLAPFFAAGVLSAIPVVVAAAEGTLSFRADFFGAMVALERPPRIPKVLFLLLQLKSRVGSFPHGSPR